MELTLQDDEVAYLERVLQESLSDLRMEIAGTESFDLRERLKRDEAVLKSILRRLNPSIAL